MKHRQNKGFTLVEVLMALAISSLLITGLGVAFNASMVSYNANKDTCEGLNHARLALARMTSELRTGYWIDPNAASNECNFYNASGDDIGYEYRSQDKTLYLVTHDNNNSYTLCPDVESAAFTKVPNSDQTDCQSVHIAMTVKCGDVEQTFSQAVAIRRNLE